MTKLFLIQCSNKSVCCVSDTPKAVNPFLTTQTKTWIYQCFFKKDSKQQINHNELVKILICTANKSVPWRKCTWRISVKDGIALQLSWYFEIRKQHSNDVRLLRVYAPNPLDWHSNVWNLIDLLERHADSCKRIETTWR